MLAWPTSTIYANTLMLDHCRHSGNWEFMNGGEFPGAKGSIGIVPKEAVVLNFDFSKGGRYVGMQSRFRLPDKIQSLTFSLSADNDSNVGVRITDASGRVFQSFPATIGKDNKKLTICMAGKWADAWGGEKSTSPKQPLKSIMLIASIKKNSSLIGKIFVDAVTANLAAPVQVDFIGQSTEIADAAWNIKAEWLQMATSTILKLTARKLRDLDAELSITFPQKARDLTTRYWLLATKSEYEFFYNPPLLNGGNTHNIYQIKLELNSSDGSLTKRTLLLTGRDSVDINFGKPIASSEIVESKVGTCTHFSFGTFGAFRGWKPYRELIDSISACGFKWIRDECRIINNPDGSFTVRPYDIEWMKYAHNKKLKIILVMGMAPKGTIERSISVAEAVVSQTREFVSAYELGNEPQNTGWRKVFKGSWNGYETDGTISKWVKEHVKCTNAIADHIKRLFPNTTIIGLGACSPTNFHALNLGVSENLDGIVDHPYTYSMPPESIPFGHGLTKRDGIKIGDKNHTYAGLVNSYIDHFKKTGKMRSLWMTEFGFTTFWFNGKTEKGLYAGFSEEAQAVFLVRRFLEDMVLPIAASCQYDFLDDYGSSQFKDEANFGIMRADHSKKPAYYAIQRMNSLFNGYSYTHELKIVIDDAPLHRSCIRDELVKKWDETNIRANNGIMAFGFANAKSPQKRMLAVWSAQPFSGEFNNRSCTIRISGGSIYKAIPIAIDLITGQSYDLMSKVDGDDLILENLSLKNHPLIIKLLED
ncbi:MAG: hypothetical protein JXR78_11090 [Victivallales bacterium]|nr:hypothetical protein [Victivallales bacterium]